MDKVSKVEELIQQYCPDGVEYRKIGALTTYEQPGKYIVESTNYDDSYSIPVLTAGQSFVLGYTNETNDIYNASKDDPVIIFDDFTGAFKWVDFPFKVKSSAMKMIKANDDLTTLRYLYHCMGYLNFSSSEHKRLWLSIYSEFEVPLPALPVQREIVRILDEFSLLSAELAAELAARQQQFEHYTEELMKFQGCEYKPLSTTNELLRGKRLTTRDMVENGKHKVFHGGIEPIGFYNKKNRSGNTVMIINVGASAGTVGFAEEDFWSSDGCFCLAHSEMYNNRFLYYYLLTKQRYLQQKVRKAGIPTLDNSVVEKILVPAISLDKQNHIVDLLNNFNSLVNSISEGIPAEIEARQKQYEYYRDKLLTFKRLES